jgi:hypothetical protein
MRLTRHAHAALDAQGESPQMLHVGLQPALLGHDAVRPGRGWTQSRFIECGELPAMRA